MKRATRDQRPENIAVESYITVALPNPALQLTASREIVEFLIRLLWRARGS
jgi:hypothetical protein